ncbi:RsfA family transcriptional regulator [Virgibacillus halodenitrificans]|uniref:RsfA family transcriptional regulator n=1 Tax=Virgibacillus halodenitrificans TaxID=1482 RepID=UPI000EF43DDF|nr:RsfA family transcriptional regulator [Virgibacillus halodenitrificans]
MSKSSTRQDSWNKEEDELLAKTVIQHIKDGSTQMMAFEKAAEILSRTSAACGFRWNSMLRKNYQGEINKAKEERKNRKEKSLRTSSSPANQLELSMIIEYLQQLEMGDERTKKLEEMLNQERKEKESIVLQLQEVKKKYKYLQALLNQVQEVVMVQEDKDIITVCRNQ